MVEHNSSGVAAPRLGSLHLDSAQEAFQHAYVYAVLAAARCTSHKPWPDVDGVDLGVRYVTKDGPKTVFSMIELQLKSTRQPDALSDEYVSHTLRKPHYDLLRMPDVAVPRLLVVTVVPEKPAEWLDQDEDRLALLRCSYWLSLLGRPAITTDSKTVRVPRENVFDVRNLCRLMHEARPDLRLGA